MNISDYRSEFAAFSSAIELAHYRHRAGFEPQLHTEPIYERYHDLFTRDAVEGLKQALAETPASQETERAGLNSLLGMARIGFLDIHAKELTDEYAHCLSSAQVDWVGERVALHSVPKIVANEPDAHKRGELTARWVDAIGNCNDLRASRLESLHESARVLGADSYSALYREITGTDLRALAAKTDAFLASTETPYLSALRRAAARDLPGIQAGELGYGDFSYFQRLSRLDSFFPASDVLPTYQAAMQGLGIRVEQQTNIHIDSEVRPTKNPRAACFRINAPDDVRLLVAPVGGVYDYTVLFHEAGHAQHFGWSSRELIKRYPEFLYSPDHATMEGYAFLLNYLFLDPLWLREYLPNISEERVRDIQSSLALLAFHNVRRYCARLHYELTLHESPTVRSEHLAHLYAQLQTEATGFSRSPQLYLWDVDDGFYAAAYLRAWAFEVGLREHLRTRYGRRWWASRKAGDELIDLWNTASRYTVEELARLIGFGDLSFELLAESLTSAVSEE
ncbi:MAG TPA: hypothetical protein VJS44_16045 [Pyrinomonadaceae bacterium]|nr:hypothetical protein [Pyrinomonadaceae bacterium]